MGVSSFSIVPMVPPSTGAKRPGSIIRYFFLPVAPLLRTTSALRLEATWRSSLDGCSREYSYGGSRSVCTRSAFTAANCNFAASASALGSATGFDGPGLAAGRLAAAVLAAAAFCFWGLATSTTSSSSSSSSSSSLPSHSSSSSSPSSLELSMRFFGMAMSRQAPGAAGCDGKGGGASGWDARLAYHTYSMRLARPIATTGRHHHSAQLRDGWGSCSGVTDTALVYSVTICSTLACYVPTTVV